MHLLTLTSLLAIASLTTPSHAAPNPNPEIDLSSYNYETLTSAITALEDKHIHSVPALNLTKPALSGGRRPVVLAAVKEWVEDHFSADGASSTSTSSTIAASTSTTAASSSTATVAVATRRLRKARRAAIDTRAEDVDDAIVLAPVRFMTSGEVVYGDDDGVSSGNVKRDDIVDSDSAAEGEQRGVTLSPVRFMATGKVVYGDGNGDSSTKVKRDDIVDSDSAAEGDQRGVTLSPVRIMANGAVVFGDGDGKA